MGSQTTGDDSAPEADNQDDTQADTNDDSGDPEKLITAAKHAKPHGIQAKVIKITGANKSDLGEGLSPELQAAEQAAENAASMDEGVRTEQMQFYDVDNNMP